MQNKNLAQVTDISPRTAITGTVASAAVYGLMVAYENDTDPEDTRKLVPATGRPGYFLTQEVKTEEAWEAAQLAEQTFVNNLRTSVPVGQAASARAWERVEVEGADHVDTANLDADTPVETPLTLSSGKWTPCTTDGQWIAGRLERLLTPKVSTNTTRFSIVHASGVYAAAPAGS